MTGVFGQHYRPQLNPHCTIQGAPGRIVLGMRFSCLVYHSEKKGITQPLWSMKSYELACCKNTMQAYSSKLKFQQASFMLGTACRLMSTGFPVSQTSLNKAEIPARLIIDSKYNTIGLSKDFTIELQDLKLQSQAT